MWGAKFWPFLCPSAYGFPRTPNAGSSVSENLCSRKPSCRELSFSAVRWIELTKAALPVHMFSFLVYSLPYPCHSRGLSRSGGAVLPPLHRGGGQKNNNPPFFLSGRLPSLP